MLVIDFIKSFVAAFHEVRSVVKYSFKSLFKSPQIFIYPYFAVSFILLTSSFVTSIVITVWRNLDQPALITDIGQQAPDVFLAKAGLVSFSVFYAAFVTSYFIVAMSASTLAKLNNELTTPLYGLRRVLKHFFRVSKFALLAVFFFPLGVIAQFSKLRRPRGAVEVIGSSFSLNMAQLAPAMLSTDEGVLETVRHSINTLGKAWRENLIIKIGMYLTLLVLAPLSFLPKLVENWWFDNNSAHIVGWLVTAMLGVASYVAVKVAGAVFTTTLYHRAKNKK